jgi:DNA-binding response OmpR family regulator
VFKILLLEDDDILGQTLKELLEINNYEVTWVKDGLLAQELIYENVFDMLLLDKNVPSLNGIELLDSFKNSKIPPAIFLTADVAIASMKQGFEAGAKDYIKKPFEFDELLIRMEALLKRSYNLDSFYINYKDFVFNTQTKELLKNGSRVHLTPIQFDLLDFLLKNRGKIVSSFELLELSNDSNSSLASLRVQLHKLKKIGFEIENIRGVGYRLNL